MKVNKLIVVFLIFLFASSSCKKQEYIFVQNQDFEAAYQNSNLNELDKDYNLLHILLLNPSYKEVFFEHDSELKSDFEGNYYGIINDVRTDSFTVETNNIKQIFNNGSLVNHLYLNKGTDFTADIPEPEISNPIYIKKDTAIFQINWRTSSDTYYMKLENGIVQLNRLSVIMDLPALDF